MSENNATSTNALLRKLVAEYDAIAEREQTPNSMALGGQLANAIAKLAQARAIEKVADEISRKYFG